MLDNPVTQTVGTTVVDLISAEIPVIGTITDIGKELLSKYNDFELQQLLKGLSTWGNLEQRLDDLDKYITSSKDRTINVANLFRKL